MNKHYFSFFIGMPILIFLQVVVLNHLWIFEYFMPILYLYPLLKMPLETERWVILLLAALTGALMDLFMNTPGLNMASAVLAGYFRRPLLLALISEEILEETDGLLLPGGGTMKFFPYLLYLVLTTLVHTAALFGLEAFSLGLFKLVIPYIFGGTAFSVITYLLFDLFSHKKES